MSEEVGKWPGYTGQCNPEVWSRAAKPPQPTKQKPGQLTEQQVNQYFDEGVVLVENYFTGDELEPVKESVAGLVDFLADLLYEEGKIDCKYEDEGFYQRLTMINRACPGANVMLHKLHRMPPAVQKLWSGDKLCNAVEQLIGSDIGGQPNWNIRVKTPQDEASTVPWHQDCAYLDTNSYSVHQPTVWLPLLDATPTNGCMEFALRGHKKGKIAMHQCCSGDTHYAMLEPDEMEKSLDIDLEKDLEVIPVKYGSVLFFNNCIPHRSLNNLSGDPGEIRWSLDLRYQDPRKPWGSHGMAHGVTFRKAGDPAWRPSPADWDPFLNSNRVSAYKATLHDSQSKNALIMETTIVGPWMKRWEIVNMNRHTDVVLKNKML